jgi:hypothetical protein
MWYNSSLKRGKEAGRKICSQGLVGNEGDKPMTEHDKAKPDEMVKQELSNVETQIALDGKIVGLDTFSEEEQNQALLELASLYKQNPIAYERRLNDFCPKGYTSFFGEGVTRKGVTDTVRKLVEANEPKALPELDVPNEIIAIAEETSDLWHNRTRVGYATFDRDDHTEHHLIEGRDYQDFLGDEFGKRHQVYRNGELRPLYPSRGDIKEAIYQIESIARRGEKRHPSLRVMEWEGALWIDSGDDAWSGYRVTADGWEVERRLSAPFIRADGMQPLPVPARDGDIRGLRQFANVRDEDDFVLFCGTLSILLNVFGDYITGFLCGPSGSGKTTATRVLRALTDPNENDTRRLRPGKDAVRDLMHGVANTHVIALENVSEISKEMSDTICALNTRTAYTERKYYNQGIEFAVNHKRPVLINGIPNNLATEPDLISRSVSFVFDHLGDSVRSNDMFWRRFDERKSLFFGALLDGLVAAMKVRWKFDGDNDAAAYDLIGSSIRFSDAVVWAEAACRGMGFEHGHFVEVYKKNKTDTMRWMAEADHLCIGIRSLITSFRNPVWKGKPTELCSALRPHMYGLTIPDSQYISRRLNLVTSALWELYGIKVQTNKRIEQNDNKTGIIIEPLGVDRGRYEIMSEPPADAPPQKPETEPKTEAPKTEPKNRIFRRRA